jgi:uncharacterized RDD family membrane protein YckC
MPVLPIYQTFWRRFWAGVCDGFLFVTVGLIGTTVVSGFEITGSVPLTLVYGFAFFSPIAYSIVMHGVYGQTLGKMVAKVRVLDLSGRRLTMRQAFLRDSPHLLLTGIGFFTAIPAILTGYSEQTTWQIFVDFSGEIWFWTEVVTMLLNDRRRAVHDFIAGSVVVRDDQKLLERFVVDETPTTGAES